jgi:molybdopterin molybdotransferase
MISVEEALKRIFALTRPPETEITPLRNAVGRVLAAPVVAATAQPPFAASIMDGYAICDHATPGDTFDVVGESAAGAAFAGEMSSGQAVRIFTGAPVPQNAIRVIIQEDVDRIDSRIHLRSQLDGATYIRAVGADFHAGTQLNAPFVITPAHVALFAAMNAPDVTVSRRPDVAIIATGDELVQPGEVTAPDQIIASNALGLSAMLDQAGAVPRILPIARDSTESLHACLDLAIGADLVITIGGASVGDHDLVARVVVERGAEMALHKVAMRPGKPLMAGLLSKSIMVGLPGNPVSSMVCGHVFILPLIRKMLGLPGVPMRRRSAKLTRDMPQNGPREHYARARTDGGTVTPCAHQDSALLGVLASADALIVRPPNAPAIAIGDRVEVLDI